MKQVIIQSEASNRILDFGGWTDTHFAQTGKVLNFAVDLYASVTIITRPKKGVMINVIDYGETLEVEDIDKLTYNDHFDLLKAALKVMGIKEDVEVHLSSAAPPGCGTGSSAAISVALINALSLLNGKPLAPHEIAAVAHGLETKELGLECGIQDQLASAMGGVNYIDMYEYPHARVSQLPLPDATIQQLNSQLLVVYEGAAHLSSAVHKKVIDNLKNPKSKPARALNKLKDVAEEAKRAVLTNDMDGLADCMNQNFDLQTQLHEEICTPRITRIRSLAMRHGASAIKINGAGGGGSVTLLCKPAKKPLVAQALKDDGFTVLPCRISTTPARAWIAPWC